MEKRFSILLALCLVLCLFAACGSTPASSAPVDIQQPDTSKPAENEQSEVLDLAAVYQSIMDAQNGTGMEALVLFEEGNPEILDGFYRGIADIELAQSHYYLPPVYGHACEIVLVEVADKNDVQAVKDILQNRIDEASSDTAYPENAEPWARNAQIQQEGNYLCLIVLPDGYVIPNNVFDMD